MHPQMLSPHKRATTCLSQRNPSNVFHTAVTTPRLLSPSTACPLGVNARIASIGRHPSIGSASQHLPRGLARDILAQPGIEGDPLAFLDVTEAYWRALRNQKHEPQKKGPTVVSYADGPLFPPPPPPSSSSSSFPATPPSSAAQHDYDVVICGGTLGLFLATALQLRGWRVAIVEKRLVQGRNQEWNISWGELQVLEELGLLSHEELRAAVVSEFNPIRVGFVGGQDMWTQDVLNLGVHPKRLLESLRRRFEQAGGVLYENTAFKAAVVHSDGLRLKLSPGGRAAPLAVGDTNRPNGLGPPASASSPSSSPPSTPATAAGSSSHSSSSFSSSSSSSAASTPLEATKPTTTPATAAAAAAPSAAPRSLTCRLLLDCMGHYSEIVRQIRGRVKPDGMCLVVGSCAEGFPAASNSSADLLYSLSHASHDMQLFWEAFPAEGGSARTTYMFAYSDAHPERPTFEQLLDTYFEMLPGYQNLPLSQLRFKRVLFGGFPCYSNGPLPPAFDRVMQIGDASAGQSPLSFGGFGSMMRHLGRLTRGLHQALSEDRLSRSHLSWLHPYQPALSASWLFQRSMSLAVGQTAYPPGYPHAPPYAATAAAAAAAAAPPPQATSEAIAAPLLLGAGAGPAAAFQEAVAMAAARFAAGAADPEDYLREEEEEQQREAGAAASAGGQPLQVLMKQPQPQPQPQQQQQKPAMAAAFERDFRTAPDWARLPYTHVNEILGTNFGVMGLLGDRVLRPFLQDTIQLLPLSVSMTGMMLANPVTVSRVLLQVGPRTLFSWFGHYAALLAYTLSYAVLRPFRRFVPYYGFQRLLDALEYGSGSDYRYHAPAAAIP
ncbi:hypothetical protein Agub_g2405, partial [Astrephomene gubernaculifera]